MECISFAPLDKNCFFSGELTGKLQVILLSKQTCDLFAEVRVENNDKTKIMF